VLDFAILVPAKIFAERSFNGLDPCLRKEGSKAIHVPDFWRKRVGFKRLVFRPYNFGETRNQKTLALYIDMALPAEGKRRSDPCSWFLEKADA
jgi:hypothetical protein